MGQAPGASVQTLDPETDPVAGMAGLLNKFRLKRIARDNAKITADQAEAEYRDSEAMLIAAMEDAGLKSVKTDNGTYTVQRTVYGKVEDAEAFIGWAATQGLEQQLTRVEVYKARVNEIVREALENGSDLPPGISFSETRFVSVRGASSKG